MLTNTKHSSVNTIVEGEFILIIEPDEALGSVLVEIIQSSFPCQVILVSDLEQARDTVQRSKPCLFLLDNYLGRELYSYDVYGTHFYNNALCTLEGRKDVPAIIMIDHFSEHVAFKHRRVVYINRSTFNHKLLRTIEELLTQAYGSIEEARAA